MSQSPKRRAALAAVLALVAAAVAPAAASAKPTIVLVHGAFADASSWNGEITRLQRAGYPVLAPAVPLRGIASDAAYVNSVLATVPGPVVLVGHSYGGAVISEAAVGATNVKALVFVGGLRARHGREPAESRHPQPRQPARPGDSDPTPARRRDRRVHRARPVPLGVRRGPAGRDGRAHGGHPAADDRGRARRARHRARLADAARLVRRRPARPRHTARHRARDGAADARAHDGARRLARRAGVAAGRRHPRHRRRGRGRRLSPRSERSPTCPTPS